MRVLWLIPLFLLGCSFIGGGREERAVATRGAVCGMPEIQGVSIGDVPGNGACGIEKAVAVNAVSGVSLSRPAQMDCHTARTLNAWVKYAAIPEVGETGGGLATLEVAAHYACRTRNNRPGARLSEHAKGKAIDISAFRLADGSEISVLDHWGGGARGRILKRLHGSACGPFGTVLGPESDRHHQDHFHFDTAEHGYGPYCR
ncbi:extensin family protein [Roseovarius aestuariivivens]|uniref:extensin-like domain-containing protein n=1 Tax=Roseovarius aestuariivivens TaxID=1888910 RepID=UPI001081C085|nr:extensin family protein [Roseovarius aestuariivivens]